MGTLDTFKVMKVDDFGENLVSFRTSRACPLLGILFLVAGAGIVLQLLVSNQSTSLFSLCAFCSVVAIVFICCGVSLISYRRQVTLDENTNRIEVYESSVIGKRKACYHFSEITNIELARDNECIFSLHAKLWVVRTYVRHHDVFIIEKVFSSLDLSEARRAADKLSFATQTKVAYTSDDTQSLGISRQHAGRVAKTAIRSMA